MLLSMETIFKRINKLEEANQEKDKKIQLLEEKLKTYEPDRASLEHDSYNIDNIDKINKYNINKFDCNTISSNAINSNNTLNNNTLLEIREELNSSNTRRKKENEKNNSSEYFDLGEIQPKQKINMMYKEKVVDKLMKGDDSEIYDKEEDKKKINK